MPVIPEPLHSAEEFSSGQVLRRAAAGWGQVNGSKGEMRVADQIRAIAITAICNDLQLMPRKRRRNFGRGLALSLYRAARFGNGKTGSQ